MSSKIKKTAFDKLIPKHKVFVKNYVEMLNARKAYSAAYPTCKNSTANVNGPKLLTNTRVKEALKEYYDNLWERKDDYIGIMFKNLLNIIDFDISDYLDENGKIDLQLVKDKKSFAISEVRESESTTKYGLNVSKGIKSHDKLKAISEMNKILGMIKEKIEIEYDPENVKAIQEIFNERIYNKTDN